MIFVTVGLAFAFERLIKEMDTIAERIDESVVIQIGNTIYEPKNAEHFKFISGDEIEKFYDDARIIVSHAGVGSMLTALKYNKPIVVVPREMKYGEAVDNHQLEIAMEWEKEGKIIVVYDIKNLESVLSKIDSIQKINDEKNSDKLVEALKSYIDQLEYIIDYKVSQKIL